MILIFALKDEVEYSLFSKVLRLLCELGKHSSGYAGHLPWLVKLPRLKIGWEPKTAFPLCCWCFLQGIFAVSFYVLLPSSLLFQFLLSAWGKLPQFSTFISTIKERERNEWIWKSYSQYPQVHWFSKLSLGYKTKCAELPHFSLQKGAWRSNTKVSWITL